MEGKIKPTENSTPRQQERERERGGDLQRREASCGRAEEAKQGGRGGRGCRKGDMLPPVASSRRSPPLSPSPSPLLSLASPISSPGRAGALFLPLLTVSSGSLAGFLLDLPGFSVFDLVSGQDLVRRHSWAEVSRWLRQCGCPCASIAFTCCSFVEVQFIT
jgi:hypothetical protein